jgi:hypothetical protein
MDNRGCCAWYITLELRMLMGKSSQLPSVLDGVRDYQYQEKIGVATTQHRQRGMCLEPMRFSEKSFSTVMPYGKFNVQLPYKHK